jgi:hypothetical protein
MRLGSGIQSLWVKPAIPHTMASSRCLGQPEEPAYPLKKSVGTTSLSSSRLAVKINLNDLRLNSASKPLFQWLWGLFVQAKRLLWRIRIRRLAASGASASAFIYVFIYVFAAESNVFECANRGAHHGASQ